MHEWALAEAIVETACNYVFERGARKITFLKVKIGSLQSADRDILRFALEELFKGKGIEVERLSLDEEEAVFKCMSCGKTWHMSDLHVPEEAMEAIHFIPEAFHAYVRCPSCGSQDLDVVSGRGVYIASMEL